MKYKPYSKYKDSGIEWLGRVPKQWSVGQAKRSVRIGRKGGMLIKGKMYDSPEKGLFPGFSASGQDVWIKKAEYFTPGIVLSAVGARCGKAFKADGHWTAIANTHVLLPVSGYNRNFLWYIYNNEDWWEKGGTAQPYVRISSSLSRKLAFPPIEKQIKIANYLDKKTEKSNAIIEKNKKQIELLKERRQAIISQAVTKGLNPKVKMKDSGVDWIGKIPKDWDVISLGRLLAYEQPGDYISSSIDATEYRADMIPVLTANKSFIIGYTDEKDNIYNNNLPVVIFDDFTTNKKFVDFPFKVRSSALKILKIRNKIENDIRFIFRSMEVLGFHVLEHNRHWIPMYSKVNITHPSLSIQKQIADFLNKKTNKIDNLIKKIELQNQKLKEFSQSLISNVVTGKIKI